MNQATIVWVHGDCLSPHNPALLAHPQAAAVWVWDDVLLAEWHISLKRILFLYECLLELPVTIRRGELLAELLAFAARHNAQTIATTPSPSPRFIESCDQLRAAGLLVELFEVEPFFDAPPDLDLSRFSHYWRLARPLAMKMRQSYRKH
jgi:hypothetical protein